MLYHLFEYLQVTYDFPGASLFQYISFRAAMATIISLLVSLVFGERIIRMIKKKQIGEEVRKLGLEGEETKKGTPTMGGIIILAAILLPTILFAKLDNIYVQIMILESKFQLFQTEQLQSLQISPQELKSQVKNLNMARK